MPKRTCVRSLGQILCQKVCTICLHGIFGSQTCAPWNSFLRARPCAESRTWRLLSPAGRARVATGADHGTCRIARRARRTRVERIAGRAYPRAHLSALWRRQYGSGSEEEKTLALRGRPASQPAGGKRQQRYLLVVVVVVVDTAASLCHCCLCSSRPDSAATAGTARWHDQNQSSPSTHNRCFRSLLPFFLP